MIEISESAQGYLRELLAKQDDADVGIRVFVAQPGTPHAETCIAYCRPGEEQEGDIAVSYEGFTAWFEERSAPYLEEAVVDYQEDRMGGQLTIKAPNARIPKVGPDAPLEDRINYVLYNEINPGLAAHGGNPGGSRRRQRGRAGVWRRLPGLCGRGYHPEERGRARLARTDPGPDRHSRRHRPHGDRERLLPMILLV